MEAREYSTLPEPAGVCRQEGARLTRRPVASATTTRSTWDDVMRSTGDGFGRPANRTDGHKKASFASSCVAQLTLHATRQEEPPRTL